MSSEFSCDYCSAMPRHPCHSRAEAAECPNQSDPGMYLEMTGKNVAAWIRYNISGDTDEEIAAIEQTCAIIERDHFY